MMTRSEIDRIIKLVWRLSPSKKNPGSRRGSTTGGTEMLDMISEDEKIENLLPAINGAGEVGRARRWLEERLKRGRKEPFGEVATLTPELAALLLERNPDNRKVKPSAVSVYARDIEAGRFRLNGEAVIVAITGELNDGQNRCHAVLKTMKSVKTFFSFGVERETRTTVDQGSARTAGDYLAMDGYGDTNNLAAIAAKIIEIERFGKLTTGAADRPTKGEQVERVCTDSKITTALRSVRRKGANKVAALSILGSCYYLFREVNKGDADYFIDKLITGTELPERDPILVAREKLLTRDRSGRKCLTANEQLKAIIMAWNNYRSNKKVRTLTHSVRKGEKLPEIR